MKKSEIIIKIGDMPEDSYDLGSLRVGVFYAEDPDTMVDEHVVDELFPELEEMDMADLSEGELEYTGMLDKYELSELLEEVGFTTQIVLIV